MYIDLNSDLGESFGAYTMGMDEEVLKEVSSANVACGWHAGDPLIMEKTVLLCKQNGVSIGAHPGYPDLMAFGRRNIKVTPDEARLYTLYQLGALHAIAKAHGCKIQHVKLHGAFYNTASIDPALADAVLDGIQAFHPDIYVMTLSGSYMAQEAIRRGIPTIQEVFADRGYLESGSLVPRTEPGAFVKDPDEALVRIIQMLKKGTVIANTGKEIPIVADSVCVHGDNPKALAFVKAIKEGLIREGIDVKSFMNRK